MESNLELLPTEISEHIFSYLDTVDIISLSKINQRLESVCLRKKLNSKIYLNRTYNVSSVDFTDFVSRRPRCEIITILNINCLYWIPAAELRRNLTTMTSLKCLYAVDTKLSLLKSDYLLYRNIPKLNRLAVSASRRTFWKDDILYYFPKVTHFYLHLDSTCDYIVKSILSAISKLKTVEELWLIESGTLNIPRTNIFIHPPENMKTFTYLVCRISFSLADGVYSNRWFRSTLNGIQACWESDIDSLRIETHGNKYWEHLLSLFLNDCPFSVQQTKELMLEKQALETINFDELNFLHGDSSCGNFYKTSIETVLLYPNVKLLRKLSLSFCALLEIGNANVDKKRKLDDVPKSLLEKIAENSCQLEELELWSCRRVDIKPRVVSNSIECIANFAKLKKLTLDNIPLYVNPSFLIKICTSCKRLTSLRVKSRQQNSTLHNMLCLALKKTVSLKDLRYEHPCNISIDRLFDALVQNRGLRLERLFVKCKAVEIFSAKPFQSYLQINKELKFLYIVVKDLPKTAIARITMSLEHFKRDPQRVIVITQDEINCDSRVHVPNFHVFEMVKLATNICILDVFNGFTK